MSQNIRYLHIDSINRSYGQSLDFAIELKPAIFSVKSVHLLALSLPITNYTVDSTNNLIYFTDRVTEYIATITSGIYTSNDITTAIKTAMEATGYGGVITATFSENTYMLTIDSTVNIELQFGTYSNNSASHILGFDDVDTAVSASLTGNNSINLSVPPCIFIKINEFPVTYRSSNGYNGMFPIYINTISGEINFHFPYTHFKSQTHNTKSQLNQLHISLLDPRTGLPFDINDNEWTMLLQLEY
jgi:hypothetical protein